MALFNITDEALKKSATQFKRELLMLPIIGAEATLQHFTARPGVGGRQVVGQIGGGLELGPYDPNRIDTTGITITPRVLETYLASTIKRFDINEAAGTIYGELVAQGKSLESANLALQVLQYLSLQLSKKLNMALFAAKRSNTGTTTMELFNGFDTIAKQEEDAGALTVKPLAAFTNENAVDQLLDFYRSASPELREQTTKLYISPDIYDKYTSDFAASFQAAAYNTSFEKRYLIGSDNKCELVPLASKAGSKYIQLSTKSNMLYGYGAGLADENISIERHHEFLLSYVAAMYFGVQYESISPERLHVGLVQ